MKYFLSFLLICFLFISGFLLGRYTPSYTSINLDMLDNPIAVLDEINSYRSSLGQSPMSFNDSLCKLANERISEIKTDWSHSGFRSRASQKNFFSEYCPYCKSVGEDLAKSFYNESMLVQAWIHSPTHLRNILDPFKNACIVVNDGYAVLESSY